MWQFENDKIWASYKSKAVIKEAFDAEMTEKELQGIISDIYDAYKDGDSIEDIARDYDVEVKDVKDAISITKKQLSDEKSGDPDLIKKYNIGQADTSNTVQIDPDKRGDTIDLDFDPEWDEIHGRKLYGKFSSGGNVTSVPPQKSRRKSIGGTKIKQTDWS